jgi:hypothetical protein
MASSAAKKADVALRISLPRRSSFTSLISQRVSAGSSLYTSGRWPASTSACRIDWRKKPGFAAIDRIVAALQILWLARAANGPSTTYVQVAWFDRWNVIAYAIRTGQAEPESS